MKFSNQNRNRIIALLSMLAAGILIGQIFSTAERTVQAKVQKELADEVLRFHVLANSDSTLDQEMKLCVRNEILEFLQTEMPTGAGQQKRQKSGCVPTVMKLSRLQKSALRKRDTMIRSTRL